eukprot:15436217-Alexandrium_andersonii.AAC.1
MQTRHEWTHILLNKSIECGLHVGDPPDKNKGAPPGTPTRTDPSYSMRMHQHIPVGRIATMAWCGVAWRTGGGGIRALSATTSE